MDDRKIPVTEMENDQGDGTEMAGVQQKRKRRSIWAAAAVLLVLLLIGTGAFVWWKSHQVMDTTTKYWFDKMAQDGTLEGKEPQEIQGMLNQIVEEGMFNVSINAQATFDNGKSEGSLGMENIPENRYYARVVLVSDADESVLYESKGIKPGQYIDKIKLKKNLESGEYPCTARIIATDPDTLEDIGQVQVKINVVVIH